MERMACFPYMLLGSESLSAMISWLLEGRVASRATGLCVLMAASLRLIGLRAGILTCGATRFCGMAKLAGKAGCGW